MRTIAFQKQDIHKGSLILINPNYPLWKRGIGQELPLTSVSDQKPDILLELKTAAVLSHLLNLLKCQEDILPVSGYRSYEEQNRIYTDSILENGREFTTKYVALPGHSEHQTGLAIDLALRQESIDFIRPDFPYEGICGLFREKALLHGFVERYQRDKEKVTGIAHEPWHFRYVGYPHSYLMKENHLVLEEYLELLKGFPYEGEHFTVELGKQKIEIFYVECANSLTEIQLPEDAIYQVSGNNMDGFIITLWR